MKIMSKELDKLVGEILETEKMANVDPESFDWRARPSITNTKREAQARLADLKKKYEKAIVGSTVSIFALGDKADEFAAAAVEESKTPIIVLDADEFYKKISTRVEATLGARREFGTTQMVLIVRGLTDMAEELGIGSFDSPKFVPSGVLPDSAAVLGHVRTVVRTTLGDEFNRIYLMKEIIQRALASRYTNSVLPVIIKGLEGDDEITGLRSITARFGARVVASEAVTQEFVLGVFKEVQEKIKSKVAK
jgi:hypothetical protein